MNFTQPIKIYVTLIITTPFSSYNYNRIFFSFNMYMQFFGLGVEINIFIIHEMFYYFCRYYTICYILELFSKTIFRVLTEKIVANL